MPILIPYSLTFHSGLRVGTRGVNLEEAGLPVPSDTLFAALVDVFRRAGEDPQVLLAPYLQSPPDPPFLLTSAFPFAGKVRFFPMPLDLTRLFSRQVLASRGKSIKHIRYLSQGLLERALAGKHENMDDWLYPEGEYEEPTLGAALQGGSLWITVDEIQNLPEAFRRGEGKRHALRNISVWAEGQVPRVRVDRISSASTIYHSGRITFNQGCGLWFGVAWRTGDLAWQDRFNRALTMLGEDGLGGERSSGYGAFQAEAGTAFKLPGAASAKLAYLLSRYHPYSEELPEVLAAEGTAYQLDAVGGWLSSPDGPAQRRKRVLLVSEGSLVALSGEWAGDVVDVTPAYTNPQGDLPHPVFRFGLALAAGWFAEGEARCLITRFTISLSRL